jgi:hypothetical protein
VQVFFFAFFYLHPQDALWRGLVARAGVFFVFIPDLKMGLFCGVIFEFLFLGCELSNFDLHDNAFLMMKWIFN